MGFDYPPEQSMFFFSVNFMQCMEGCFPGSLSPVNSYSITLTFPASKKRKMCPKEAECLGV